MLQNYSFIYIAVTQCQAFEKIQLKYRFLALHPQGLKTLCSSGAQKSIFLIKKVQVILMRVVLEPHLEEDVSAPFAS